MRIVFFLRSGFLVFLPSLGVPNWSGIWVESIKEGVYLEKYEVCYWEGNLDYPPNHHQQTVAMSRASGHIPRYPRGFIILRIFQLVFNLAILGLCAYATYIAAFSGDILMLATVRPPCNLSFPWLSWLTRFPHLVRGYFDRHGLAHLCPLLYPPFIQLLGRSRP